MTIVASRFWNWKLIWDFAWFSEKQPLPSLHALVASSIPAVIWFYLATRTGVKLRFFRFRKMLWNCFSRNAVEITRVPVTNQMKLSISELDFRRIGAYLAGRDAFQVLKQFSMTVEERRWSLLKTSNVNLPSDLLCSINDPACMLGLRHNSYISLQHLGTVISTISNSWLPQKYHLEST